MKITKDWTMEKCQMPKHMHYKHGCVWIYGLFDATGICMYVGRTINFGNRFVGHKSTVCGRMHGVDFTMLPLTRVSDLKGYDEEKKFQKAYEEKGEAVRSMLIPNHLIRKWKQNNYSLDGILR